MHYLDDPPEHHHRGVNIRRRSGVNIARRLTFEGRLTLADLGAYAVTPPLPYETPRQRASGRPMLVLENHHSYESFRCWNRDTGRYSAVAYGGGWAFCQSAGRVDDIAARTGANGVLYLGDLDPPGVEVLAAVNAGRSEDGRPGIAPHRALYVWLLDHGTRRPLGKLPSLVQHKACFSVFDDELGRRVLDLWASGSRVPQESFGTEQLAAQLAPVLSW